MTYIMRYLFVYDITLAWPVQRIVRDEGARVFGIVGAEGVGIDPEKTRAVRDWPTPTTLTEVIS